MTVMASHLQWRGVEDIQREARTDAVDRSKSNVSALPVSRPSWGAADRSGAGRPAWRDDRLRGRRPVTQTAVWADCVVMAPPRFDENLGLLEGVEDLPVQKLGIM